MIWKKRVIFAEFWLRVFNMKTFYIIMRKVIFAITSMMLLTSCVGDLTQKIKKMLGEAGADSTAAVATISETAQEDGEDIKDLPLLAAGGYDESDWYAPVGFVPQSLSQDEFSALSEEQQNAEYKRHEKETAEFMNMLKQNKERYTKLFVDDTWKDVEFVEGNFDRGQESTFAMGWQGEERKDHMKYLRYRPVGGKINTQFEFGMLFTKEYVNSHNFLKVTDRNLAMPEDIFNKIEKQTGKKIASVPYGYALGKDYSYFVVLFGIEGQKAYAIHAVKTPEGLALSEMETTDVDESGEAMWAVDMEGEYPMMNIHIAETAGKVLKIWYTDLAPEHACLGAFIVKGNKITKREHSQNYIWVN